MPFASWQPEVAAAGLASVRALAVATTHTAATAASTAAANAVLLPIDSLPSTQLSPQLPTQRLVLPTPTVGDEPVTLWRRSGYNPRGRAAPKNLPVSERANPIRSYISSSVGSDARRAFSAPTASSRWSSR